ncbi:hypothetical protein [Hymenobacter chitinivorans]|uniref:Uncharacterized protein n=1 Tax=Hymenobacter chitinivorans DSM 11115 TaxID=1121954 RepID=A0A2M9BQE1_9BACT|nr:hypothetical protein [Hymenobacter chitinivorans]PJJ60180.1 hypothetical protein CLV45_1605 [Hymenobacter chitinivorans DSM 11115]
MDPILQSKITRKRIEKLYRTAIYAYSAPFALLLLQLLAPNKIGTVFFAASLFSLPLLVVVGLRCTILGLRLAFKTNDYQKKDLGYANLIMGLILAGLAVIGLGFAFLRIS